MAPGIGASGVMGLAVESTPGTYAAPTIFFPFNSETLQFMQETNWRRPIRNSASIIGAVPGNVHTEGEITMEALSDIIPWFLLAARTDVVADDTDDPVFEYEFTPSPRAVPQQTLSLTVVRNGVVFGYTGIVVTGFTFSIDNGLLNFNVNVLGSDEAVQTAPVPVWPTTTPFGAGQYEIEMPTGSPISDMDAFSWSTEDNGEPQYRLRGSGERGAKFIKFGEHNSTLTAERDFESRADYDAFKALTAQSLTLVATKSPDEYIELNLTAAIKDTYAVNLAGQGDLVRGSVSYQAVADSSGIDYKITIRCTADLGL